jgi:hypothetical protein
MNDIEKETQRVLQQASRIISAATANQMRIDTGIDALFKEMPPYEDWPVIDGEYYGDD